jgi:hypothetical protein
MSRVDTEQADVLDAIVARLLDQIDSLSDKNCFISLLPNPPYKCPDNLFVTVSPTAGTFPAEFLDGGGQNQCVEATGVLVTIFSRYMASRPGQDRETLSDQTRGVLRLKRLILKALTDHDLQFGGNLILRDPILPTDSGNTDPVEQPGQNLVQLPLKFALAFDWNLTA